METGWKQVAAVTTGGKPFFYVNAQIQMNVVWNRVIEAWTVRDISTHCIAYKDTAPAAMKAAEEIAARR